MEGMSRVKKYKSLRDSITNGEETNQIKDDFIEEVSDDDDDFLDFPEFKLEDDLSFTSEDLSEEVTKETMSRVRDANGESVSFNTRLDILQQIKAANMNNGAATTPAKKGEKTVTEKKTVEKVEKVEDDDFQQSISDIIKNDDLKIKKEEKVKVEEVEEAPVQEMTTDPFDDHIVDSLEDSEPEESESSITEKILTFIIVVFSIALLAMIGYIIKLFLS